MDPNEINLRVLVNARFKAVEREMELRFTALEREMNLELRSSAVALEKAHSVLERQLEAIDKREYATREELMTLRDSFSGQAQSFALRSDMENLRVSHEEQLRHLGRQVYLIAGGLAVLQIVAQIFFYAR